MHTLTSNYNTHSIGRSRSISSSLTAFGCAFAGAGVTSHLVFDHQPPSQPEDVVTYLATLGATVIAGWWLANVLAWAVALRRGIQLDRFTLPGTKRIAQFMLAALLSTSCVADASGDPVMVLVDHVADSSSTLPINPTTTSTSVATIPTTLPPTTTPAATTTEPSTEDPPVQHESDETTPAEPAIERHQVVVNDGDNLWSLAAETLTSHRIEAPTTGQVAEYWRLVVAANQVRSGNPDLIVAGEAITMPAFELSATARPDPSSQMDGIGAR